MDLSEIYEISASEKVQDQETELKTELTELQEELEETTASGYPSPSSVQLPTDITHFRLERKLILRRALQVSEAKPLFIQADQMKDEMMNATHQEYTVQSIPLLLHQYFTDRIQQLIQSRHQHMLRWKRFCEHSSTIEVLYPLYKQKLSKILAEYHDSLQRAQRLAVARECMLSGFDTPVTALKMEDLLIYLRWLVYHLHSVKRFNQYMKVIQWLPVSNKCEIAPPDPDGAQSEEVSTATQIGSRYQDDNVGLFSRQSTAPRPNSATSGQSTSSTVPIPPPIHPALLSTSPLPMSSVAMLNAAAAAGGGLASDEKTQGLPIHVNEFDHLKPHLSFLINIYGINYDLNVIHNTADEMEMFASVSRKFKQIFLKQEHLRTLKTYDRLEVGQDAWGSDSSSHALKQESNWIPFIKLKPVKDQHQEKHWTQLRQANKVDELLRVSSFFLKISDSERIQDTLKEHATYVRNPPGVSAASVTSHRTNNNTSSLWKKIYTNPELHKENVHEDSDVGDYEVEESESVGFEFLKSSSLRKRKESYDYMNSVQLLGLDEGEQVKGDPINIQGAYLSFLQLRHLRLRDLQRTCLSILNYFRSIERTLTINDGGLSRESGGYKRKSNQNHRTNTETEGTVGGGGGLSSHMYLHHTPADFKLSESEFMEFDEVENHDDFYTVDEGRIHVQDQRGYYIIYNSSLDDLKKLEKDMLLIGTHYIEKDRELREAVQNQLASSSRRNVQQTAGDFNIASYAHEDIDRFGVLLDLWSSHCAFLEGKRELLDCYYEAYQHVFDRDERRNLAQVITNIIGQNPRFDFTSDYFVKIYRVECCILHYQSTLVKKILDNQIEEQRSYVQRVCREGDSQFGLPNKIIAKQPISVNLSRPALKNVYMLEFHPTLAIASRIPAAFKHAYWEFVHIHQPETIYDSLMMEKKLMEFGHLKWDKLENIGRSFSPQLQKELFSDIFIEDPLFLCEIAQSLVTQQESQSGTNRSTKEKQTSLVQVITRVMETVTCRYRLIDASWETEILSKIYKKQANEMGFDEFHMFLRFVQFEFASFKDDAGKPPPVFITSIQEDDTVIDKYAPCYLYLAIHELDEGHVGRFTFRTRDGLLQVLRPGGVESLQVTLKTQIVHKNALMAAILQADACQPVRKIGWKSGRASPSETKSEKSSMTQYTGLSSGTQGTSLGGKLTTGGEPSKNRRAAEAFVSLQLEKTPSRDIMLNEFVEKKAQMGTILRNPEELEKLKRKLVSEFCENFNLRVSQFSLRAQIIAYYSSILTLLDEFPYIRDKYFMIGEPNEKKPSQDNLEGLKDDPRQFKHRPRRVISSDGHYVCNIWFIPHYTETLIMYKTLDDMKCARALSYTLSIAATMHDMLHYLCAHSKLGSSHARLGSQKLEFVSADWGGTEGVGAELRHIQTQLDHLLGPHDPIQVADFLTLRRDVMFLEFDTAVRHCMTDTFLSTGNIDGYKAITENIFHALPALSNIQIPSACSLYLSVPEPLEARDFQARHLYPWRSFLGRNGLYPLMYWQWHLIEHHIQTCLAGLKDVDRHVANGEILGVTLLMEDVLQSGYQSAEDVKNELVRDDGKGKKKPTPKTVVKKLFEDKTKDHSLSRTDKPMESYILLKFFLRLWKCLELAKHDWGQKRLQVEKIDTTQLFKEHCKLYRTDILLPVLQSIARRLGQGDLYDGQVLETDMLIMPKGASEIEVRAKQLVRLFENLECFMINEVRKKAAKEFTLSMSEKAREEGALPTDLWKRSVMKESYTIARPHLAEAFIDKLMSDCEEGDETVVFSRDHLKDCFGMLSRGVMAREKSCFESYSMYYENLLRVHHQLLYQKEQEIKHMQDQQKNSQLNTTVEVQYRLATEARDIIMEVTALRAKIAEMRNMSLTQERDIRERIKGEYDELVQNMFNSTFQLRAKFDEFRGELYDDVFEKIKETRRIAVEEMSRLGEKSSSTGGQQHLTESISQSEKMRNLQHENHTLNILVIKMKAMNSWRQNHSSNNFVKTITGLKQNADNSKKEVILVKMLAEEESQLLQQELVAVKKALTTAEKECEEVRRDLDKELKIKLEKAHEQLQKERSKKQLEQAKQANIEKLLEDLEDKEMRLTVLTEEQDRTGRLNQMTQDKVKKDVGSIKKRLNHERNLKLDAFQRVDELQAAVYDYEDLMTNQHQTPGAGNQIYRATSAGTRGQRSSLSSRSGATSGGIWPPHVTWPQNRVMSPREGSLLNNADLKKIQRPKTVGGRFRSRIAEQLMNEIEPKHHQTMIEELQF